MTTEVKYRPKKGLPEVLANGEKIIVPVDGSGRTHT